ncbi:hypothetical protein [Paraflavitalea pollutisoli]|uniref:hypothetical protein n=1 Tax=Paraflavitalea pollutisoli TaxID=3034143 RepID=UPI0023EB6931|nr:hypothetical protein [Paraflavitalea sp. H1-2-19X]
MPNKVLLYCLAMLLIGKLGVAQPCNPAVIQQHITNFWDQYKRVDTVPAFYAAHSNRLFGSKDKQVFFMGTIHSTEIAFPLYRKIDSVVTAFKPGIILVENYAAIEDLDSAAAVAGYADAGYVTYLANIHKITVKSWDNVAQVYNLLFPKYGYDSALVMLLNSIGEMGVRAQSGEEAYAQFRYAFQMAGGLLTPAQLSFAYYQQLFEQYFGQALLPPSDIGYAAQRLMVWKDTARKRCDSWFTQLRDQRLLQVLQSEIPAYQKIYLQAGAAHFQALQDIVPCYLKPARQRVRSIRTGKKKQEQGIMVTVHARRGKKQQLLIAFTNQRDSSSLQTARIDQQIKQFAPDLVLTYCPATIAGTAAESLTQSGITGYIRYQAIDRKTALDQWQPSWGDVYAHFVDRYSNEELYLTCFAMNLLQDGAIHTIGQFRDRFYNTGNNMRFTGYPFLAGQFNFDTFIGKITRHESLQSGYTLEEMVSLVRKKCNKTLEAEIRKFQVAQWFSRPYSRLQHVGQQKIFIQMDEVYRPLLP